MKVLRANTTAATAETVLRLLRQLPPRERLHVVAQALPELERELADVSPVEDFWQEANMNALVQQQGVQPIGDWDALLGGWPEGESADDFIAALGEWRRNNPAIAGEE